MVKLDKIYTKAGDQGRTRLATGEEVAKFDARVEAYGAVDEANAAIGLARLHLADAPELNDLLARVQNDLFDLGADLATPEPPKPLSWTPLRIVAAQTQRLEADIDRLNAGLAPLTSFVLPAGTAAATYLHLARTIVRRAERRTAQLLADPEQTASPECLRYLNRLSDLLFVAARVANNNGAIDVLWAPGANRQ